VEKFTFSALFIALNISDLQTVNRKNLGAKNLAMLYIGSTFALGNHQKTTLL
jgi:hypothetical protein